MRDTFVFLYKKKKVQKPGNAAALLAQDHKLPREWYKIRHLSAVYPVFFLLWRCELRNSINSDVSLLYQAVWQAIFFDESSLPLFASTKLQWCIWDAGKAPHMLDIGNWVIRFRDLTLSLQQSDLCIRWIRSRDCLSEFRQSLCRESSHPVTLLIELLWIVVLFLSLMLYKQILKPTWRVVYSYGDVPNRVILKLYDASKTKYWGISSMHLGTWGIVISTGIWK
jgi:hypothetical protein